jgi:hypothetical protein
MRLTYETSQWKDIERIRHNESSYSANHSKDIHSLPFHLEPQER